MAKKTIHSFFTYFFPNFEWSHDYVWASLVLRNFGPKYAFLTKKLNKTQKFNIIQNEKVLNIFFNELKTL